MYARSGSAPAFIEYLARFRFSGDIDAVPERTIVFAGEPLVRVTAGRVEAQLLETLLLNQINFQTMVATKAARIALAAGGGSPAGERLVDFSPRRDHGTDAAMKAAWAAAIAGAGGTSNLAAAMRYGLVAVGTMAHSYVMSFPREEDAFGTFMEDFPGNACVSDPDGPPRRGPRTAPKWPSRCGRGASKGLNEDGPQVDGARVARERRAPRRAGRQGACARGGLADPAAGGDPRLTSSRLRPGRLPVRRTGPLAAARSLRQRSDPGRVRAPGPDRRPCDPERQPSPAEAHDSAGHPTSPGRIAFAMPNVMTVARSGDFEAVVSHGIGLAKRTSFHVSTLTHPSRVVIDIHSTFRTVMKKVYFANPVRFAANTPPFVTAVLRPVLPGAPARGVIVRLFVGPTLAEYAGGLRLPQSEATGFAGLTIQAPVARVRLTGGCSTGGSTFTIANEIYPTLSQFSTVDFVKIYSPAGHTGDPTGHSDSLPFCLNP